MKKYILVISEFINEYTNDYPNLFPSYLTHPNSLNDSDNSSHHIHMYTIQLNGAKNVITKSLRSFQEVLIVNVITLNRWSCLFMENYIAVE